MRNSMTVLSKGWLLLIRPRLKLFFLSVCRGVDIQAFRVIFLKTENGGDRSGAYICWEENLESLF